MRCDLLDDLDLEIFRVSLAVHYLSICLTVWLKTLYDGRGDSIGLSILRLCGSTHVAR